MTKDISYACILSSTFRLIPSGIDDSGTLESFEINMSHKNKGGTHLHSFFTLSLLTLCLLGPTNMQQQSLLSAAICTISINR